MAYFAITSSVLPYSDITEKVLSNCTALTARNYCANSNMQQYNIETSFLISYSV